MEDQIYYINHVGMWITVDQASTIHLWDIEEEKSEPLPKRHKGTILALAEIIHQKIVVFSTLKQQLVFWNLAMKVFD